MIRLFISAWEGRCDWLQTTAEHDIGWSIWARDDSELSCAHLNTEWQFNAKSHELISRDQPKPGFVFSAENETNAENGSLFLAQNRNKNETTTSFSTEDEND